MKKQVASLLIAGALCATVLPTAAFAAGAPVVSGTYEKGVVTITATGLTPNTEYPMIMICKADGTPIALSNGTTDADGNLVVAITTGNKVKEADLANLTIAVKGATGDSAVAGDKGSVGVIATGVTLNAKNVNLNVGGSTQLTAKLSPDGAVSSDIKWSTNGDQIATVDENGKVTAVGIGNARITVTVDGKYTDYCDVHVGTSNNDDNKNNGGSSSSSGKDDSGSSYSSSFAISTASVVNGTISIDKPNAKAGETVTITATPDSGYRVETVTVRNGNNKQVTVNAQGNGVYTFTMPSSPVTVRASFAKNGASTFTDVSSDAYYAGAVDWAVSRGITNGTTATTFNPNGSCTRAQIVTFLWRAAGSPAPKAASNNFKDVSSSAYYAQAVQWAVEQGITSGKSATKFDPNGVCTRAQAVTFLYRANGSPAVDGSASFGDVTGGAYFAKAVQWAVNRGVTNGTSATTFTPHNNCTRAQIVTFLYRAQQ